MNKLILALPCLVTLACGGGGSHGPIDPSPTPIPATLTFTPDTNSPTPRSFALVQGAETITDQITILIRANDFTSGFSMFRGTIVYDTSVVTQVNYTEGDFLKQGGGLASFSVTGLNTNQTSIRIDRPSSLVAATGTGTVIALRFKPASTTARGTSALQWDDPHAYTTSFSEMLQRTYGGSITVTR